MTELQKLTPDEYWTKCPKCDGEGCDFCDHKGGICDCCGCPREEDEECEFAEGS